MAAGCWLKGSLVAKVLAKFGATSTIERKRERDVDKNHASPIAPSAEATPTDPMNKTRNQANMIGWHVVFQLSLCWWRKSSFSPAHACPFKTIRTSFLVAIIARPKIRPIFVKNKAYFGKKSSLFLDGQVGSCLGKILLNIFFCAAQYSSMA